MLYDIKGNGGGKRSLCRSNTGKSENALTLGTDGWAACDEENKLVVLSSLVNVGYFSSSSLFSASFV